MHVPRLLYGLFAFLSTVVAVLSAPAAKAQDPLTEPLPDSLRQGAVAVNRLELVEITIESPRKIRVHRKWIHTILNNNGDAYSLIATFYDKFHDLSRVTATLYDADGKVVKKIKKSDLEDALIGGMGMLEVDTRVKYYSFVHRNYPYTIEYDEEQVLSNGFVMPSGWYPQASPRMSVLNSGLVVHAPDGYNLRYKEYDCPGPVVTPEKNGGKTYTWTLSHLPARVPEPYAVAWHRREPGVRFAPTEFEIAGYKGVSDTWGHLGKFNSDLFQGRGQLPEEARQKVHALTDGLTDTAKIAALYSWLQQNTHYVGIELGIGGWQPYDATYVYTRKYGDCKALANYMVALLKEAGVRAWPVLIYGGPEPPLVDSTFPSLPFNHCIAVALAGADSVWLECTSNTLPAGYLGSFTSDRDALLLDGPDAHLVHTPVYGVRQNHLTRRLEGTIAASGSMEATLRVGYTGLEQDAPRGMIDRLSRKDLLEERRQALGLSDCAINDYNYVSTRTAVPSLDESMRVSAEHFATVNGNRLIIAPGRFWRRTSRLQTTGPARQTAIELRVSLDESDTLVLQMPHGYTPERLPSGHISYPFGSYSVQSHFENDTLTVSCHYQEQKGVYPASSYEHMGRFFDYTWRSGNQQIVFVKP
jgi:hypothetical protein